MSINTNNQDLKNLLKGLEGRPVFILTKFDIRYRTKNIEVGETSIKFKDKFGVEVFLALDQIAQITEVNQNDF